MPVKLLCAIVQQPILDQWWNAPLLSAYCTDAPSVKCAPKVVYPVTAPASVIAPVPVVDEVSLIQFASTRAPDQCGAVFDQLVIRTVWPLAMVALSMVISPPEVATVPCSWHVVPSDA